MNKQEIIQRIIDQEIFTNASQFIDELANDYEGRYIDDLMPCLESIDYSEPPEDYIIEQDQSTVPYSFIDPDGNREGYFETEEQAIKAAWEDFGDEPEERMEALQHWLVSDWLADKLESIEACVARDVMGFEVWGRTECGQSLTMDSDLNKVADLLTDNES